VGGPANTALLTYDPTVPQVHDKLRHISREVVLAWLPALYRTRRITGIYIALFLVPPGGLIVSSVMLNGSIFNKATAVTGILANGIILTYFLALAFAPPAIVLPFVLSAPFRVAWYFLIALRLFKLASSRRKEL
jgi:hypothetical protein